MSGGDGAFYIEQDTGQIVTRATLDREKRSSYRVTVTAEDPSGARDSFSLTIAVDDVRRGAVNHVGRRVHLLRGERQGVVGTYRAEDPEGRSIEWSLSETDAEDFTFTRGVLRFKNPAEL